MGTAMLLAAVVGSGIMGERLAGGNVAIALLANTVSTGTALVALIIALGPISGAHFNAAVTVVDAWQKGIACATVTADHSAGDRRICGSRQRSSDVRRAAVCNVPACTKRWRSDL